MENKHQDLNLVKSASSDGTPIVSSVGYAYSSAAEPAASQPPLWNQVTHGPGVPTEYLPHSQPSVPWSVSPSSGPMPVHENMHVAPIAVPPLAPFSINRTQSELACNTAPAPAPHPSFNMNRTQSELSHHQQNDNNGLAVEHETFRSADPAVARLGEMISFRSMEVLPAAPTAAPSFRYIEGATASIGKISFRPDAFTSPLDDPDFCPPPQFKSFKTAQLIATQAPLTSSPLPDPEKITHSGSILSRISLRSIFFKQWKPTTWITYDKYAVYFFRSTSDLEEWATNPYLSQAQRDFLVKLKIDFVHDLNKAGVRSYEVTGLKYKQYKSEMLHNFKLERWMDYGSTLAACFASHRKDDASALNTIMVEIMKRAPAEIEKLQTQNQMKMGYVRSDMGVYHDQSGRVIREESILVKDQRSATFHESSGRVSREEVNVREQRSATE